MCYTCWALPFARVSRDVYIRSIPRHSLKNITGFSADGIPPKPAQCISLLFCFCGANPSSPIPLNIKLLYTDTFPRCLNGCCTKGKTQRSQLYRLGWIVGASCLWQTLRWCACWNYRPHDGYDLKVAQWLPELPMITMEYTVEATKWSNASVLAILFPLTFQSIRQESFSNYAQRIHPDRWFLLSPSDFHAEKAW